MAAVVDVGGAEDVAGAAVVAGIAVVVLGVTDVVVEAAEEQDMSRTALTSARARIRKPTCQLFFIVPPFLSKLISDMVRDHLLIFLH